MPDWMNRKPYVQQQYADDKKFSIRVKMHVIYSTNPQSFGSWLFAQYAFGQGFRILELGCGNGVQWEKPIAGLPQGSRLILSDFSAGMTQVVQEKFSRYSQAAIQQIDIQAIPYKNEVFDAVIANHMLYHVPDLPKGLAEVRRVLKPGGVFYAATNGSGGMLPYFRQAMQQIDPDTKAFSQDFPFNLQNGRALLSQHFAEVKRVDYNDALAITETQDLIDYMKSMMTIGYISEEHLEKLYDAFEAIRVREGAIRIPKDVGLFMARKA